MDYYTFKSILEVGVRWIHVFAAILWIGQTYLFHFFERCLEPDTRDHVKGTLWMVHGGGYYFLEKQAFRGPLPKMLHWFKWEAAVTWLSGVVLIALTFYFGGLLVTMDQEFMPALFAGVGSILGGWVVYTLLVRSPLGNNLLAFAVVSLAILMATHHGLYEVMSSRSAFLHIGAIMGTIMAANVWMKILPAQRKILAAVVEGQEPDADLLRVAPARSKHNSYMVVPLVFIMIGNHYPTITYGHTHSTIVLGCFLVVGWIGAGLMLRKKDIVMPKDPVA